MEIYSYSASGSYEVAKKSNSQVKQFLLRSFSGNFRSKSIAVKPRKISYGFNYKNVLSSITRIAKSSVKYLWLIPVSVILFLVPFTVTKIMSYAESFSKEVVFDSSSSYFTETLDTELCNLALNRNGSYDIDGTVLSSDGSAFSSVSESFKQPVAFKNYKVRAGDTIDGISRKFGLSNISTLIAVNNISNVRSLRSGQQLKIPSVDGLIHTVAKGETLNGLSIKYNVTVEDLLDVNDLSSEILSVGSDLFIPGARLDTNSLHKALGEMFAYPITAKWRLSSGYGPRLYPLTGKQSFHTGIDMACPTGTPIKAAMAGKVAYTGVSNVYGYYVIITHYDGYQTLYAHMSKIIAKKGDYVDQGTKIGLVGSTGQSTGPHLHFTVYKNGKLVNPLTVLK